MKMSLFQQLPLCIVYHILDFMGLNASNDYYSNKVLAVQLLQVSSIWREAAQTRLCYNICLGGDSQYQNFYLYDSIDIEDYASNSDYNYLGKLVRSIDLDFNEPEIIEGCFLIDKSDAVLNKLKFHNAHTLNFTIEREDESWTDYESTHTDNYLNSHSDIYKKALKPALSKAFAKHINEFVLWIARIAPNVKKVTLNLGIFSHRMRSALEGLADGLFDLFDSSVYSTLSIRHPAYNWNITQQLSELNIYWLNNHNNSSGIIKQNAATLKSLDLMFRGEQGFNNVWNILGYKENIVYPNLQKLHLNNQVYKWVNGKPSEYIDASYIPFPRLEYLKTSHNYAITDDVLFRGNEKTLVRLNIAVYRLWLSILSDIFTNRNCKQIKYLRLKLKPFEHFNYIMINESMFENITQVLPKSLYMLCFKANPFPRCLLPAQQYSRFNQLQLLKFENTVLELEQVCQLLEANPGVTEFHARNFMLGSELESKSDNEIKSILSSRYGLTNSSISSAFATMFSNNQIYGGPVPENNIAQCSSVLSMVCPKFKQIRVGARYQNTIYNHLSCESDTLV